MLRIRERRSPSSAWGYLRSGAPAPASQRFCRRLIVPFDQARFKARLTQRRSELPCSSTIPKRSRDPRVRELSDDDAVLDLHGGDEERRRQVDHDPVDLTVLQRLDSEVVRAVCERPRVGADVPDDVLVARRAELRAELVRLQRGDRLRARDLRALAADERLVHVVVGVREVDRRDRARACTRPAPCRSRTSCRPAGTTGRTGCRPSPPGPSRSRAASRLRRRPPTRSPGRCTGSRSSTASASLRRPTRAGMPGCRCRSSAGLRSSGSGSSSRSPGSGPRRTWCQSRSRQARVRGRSVPAGCRERREPCASQIYS